MNWDDIERQAEDAERRRKLRIVDGTEGNQAPRLASLNLAELAMTLAEAPVFAIERVAPLGEVTLFTGPGSSGKSLLAQQLATCAAAGLNCLGLEVMACPTLYVTCEDGPTHLHYRQERLCEALDVPMASLAGKLHLVSLRGALDNELECKDDKGVYGPSPAFHRLAETITATESKIVAIDNVAHLFAGNENDRHDVTRFVNLLNRLASQTGAAIILVGHPNKSGDTYSGSTAWLNAVRSQVWINRVVDDEGNENDKDVRALTIGKANYAAPGEALRFRWHQWAFILEGELPSDQRAEIAEIIKANGEVEIFLRCLRARMEQGEGREVGPAPGPNYAPSQFEGMPQAKGLKKAALKRAMERLFMMGKLTTATVERPGKSAQKTILVEVPERSPNASRTLVPNDPEPRPERPRTHTLIPKGIKGAGPGAPSPSSDTSIESGWSPDESFDDEGGKR
ncbi:AAA family ATPase [Novosphingobium sp. YJ-S2-02]|uniref:AAA family ATPase n=1 Tax=Novosphingobium aureum TaxID=2792964 RepID=A0A931MLR3_9SPHN|nr:AAA family ATPase [Novosphingobium aureum]MBH0114218.1 AAA family ATPase [Novosphingobium aureum]